MYEMVEANQRSQFTVHQKTNYILKEEKLLMDFLYLVFVEAIYNFFIPGIEILFCLTIFHLNYTFVMLTCAVSAFEIKSNYGLLHSLFQYKLLILDATI